MWPPSPPACCPKQLSRVSRKPSPVTSSRAQESPWLFRLLSDEARSLREEVRDFVKWVPTSLILEMNAAEAEAWAEKIYE